MLDLFILPLMGPYNLVILAGISFISFCLLIYFIIRLVSKKDKKYKKFIFIFSIILFICIFLLIYLLLIYSQSRFL